MESIHSSVILLRNRFCRFFHWLLASGRSLHNGEVTLKLKRTDLSTEKLGNEGAEKLSVLCDLESVVTRFVKQSQLRYETTNGWMAILEPLVALRLNKEDLYAAFHNMVHRFVPR